jgi:fluoride ion exporter CrcB/FEX
MRMVLIFAVTGMVLLGNTAARAQAATEAAMGTRIVAINGLLGGFATLARQTGLTEEQRATQSRKTMEAATSTIESQTLAIAKADVAREYATTSRTCPEVSAGRAYYRGGSDAQVAAGGLATTDALRLAGGIDPMRRLDDDDEPQGGTQAALLSVGMPLPPVTAPSNAAADEARRAGELRRAARVMAARYAITGTTEVQ